MSDNAKKAYEQGLFTLSKIRKNDLAKHGFYYSVDFFKWLCKNDYISPSEHHHTSASFQMTAFYSPKAISFAVSGLRLNNLLDVYKGRETLKSLISKENIKYVRIKVPSSFFGLKNGRNVVLDCIRYKNYLMYSENTIIGTDSNAVNVVGEFDEKPDKWDNKNTESILYKIVTRKKVSWNHVMGDRYQ